MSSGIYVITSLSGKQYVGSAVSFSARWRLHQHYLRKGQHHSSHLQRAWNKHGEEAFVFSVLFICANPDLLFYEQRAINVLQPEYNVCKIAGSSLGVVRSAETRAKLSATKQQTSPETRAKMAAAQKGKRLSAEHRSKIGAASLGRKMSAEAIAKTASSKVGKKHSAEARAKMSSAAMGRKHSPEWCAKMSALNKGKQLSSEHRSRIASSRRAYYASRRADQPAAPLDFKYFL